MAQQSSIPHFATQSRTVLSGSEKNPVSQPGAAKPATPTEQLTVSVIVRRKKPLAAEHASGKRRISRARFNAEHAADPEAVALVKRFAEEYGLKVQAGTPAPGRRTVKLSGTVSKMQQAFGVSLSQRAIDGQVYRVRDGSISVPAELQGYVIAVLGLDNRPQARPHFRILEERGSVAPEAVVQSGFARPHATTDTSLTPVQVGQLYQFPQGVTASGQTIGIIELGGGFRTADITAYFKSLGLKAPTVVAVPVGGGKNKPAGPNGADGEVMLDIEVAGAVAPGARIVVYFAPNTDQGFVDAIATAIHDSKYKPSVISISWGAPETQWTAQSMAALDAACQSAAALGITITVAAGDNGSSDGVNDGKNHVDFPASSPHVLACGGTNLRGSGSTIAAEAVWNDQSQGGGATGGGVSNVFPLPPWQVGANVPPAASANGGRGVPDVAGDADPATGYIVRVDGKTLVIGGTSAVAPLWAGLIAVANQQNGADAGFIQPAIYAAKNRNAFFDTTIGNNGSFSAGPGWDACTGLGSPVAPRLINAVRPASSGTGFKIAATKAKAPVRRSKQRQSAKSR
jgi:kumamolisin